MHSIRNTTNSIKENASDPYASLPLGLYTAESVREMDRHAIEDLGIDGFELMNKAARFSFHALVKEWPETNNLVVLCGSGNNAGDGYIVAALAKKRGWQVDVLYLASPEKLTGDALSAYRSCMAAKVSCNEFTKSGFNASCDHPNTVIVDALLGTGLNSLVKGSYADAIEQANTQTCPILSLDIPSGLSANTGQAFGIAIHADVTATFIGLKLGLLTGSGRSYVGKIVYSDLELDATLFEHIKPAATRLDLKSLLSNLAPRPRDAHKGTCGHAMLIGGDIPYGGAIILAATACARMGAGLTSVITQEAHRSALLSSIPEVMVQTSQNMQVIEEFLSNADVIVIGPGLGNSAWSEKMLLAALHSQKPLVIDADALNLLSEKFTDILDLETFKKARHVLTPHPGEAARLLSAHQAPILALAIQGDRLSALNKLHQIWGNNLLLKGSGSLICSLTGEISLCPYGNPGMASGGMGDVLSGLIAGLIAQGLDASYSLQLAVCLHAQAADIASREFGERGLLASDLIPLARQLI